MACDLDHSPDSIVVNGGLFAVSPCRNRSTMWWKETQGSVAAGTRR